MSTATVASPFTTAAPAAVQRPDMLAAALAYAARGWPVFPLQTPKDGGCSCRKGRDCHSPGKHPRTPKGFKDATPDTDQIRRWWKRWPDANIGLWCKDLVVVDVDPRNGGNESLGELLEPVSDSFDFGTLEALTGGGGTHYVFAAPDFPITIDGIAPGIDLKAAGGYIMVAPSMHPSGKRYEWVDADAVPTPMPGWLLDLIKAKQSEKVQKDSGPCAADEDGDPFDMEEFIRCRMKDLGWQIRGPFPSPEQIGGVAWAIEDGCPFDRPLLGGNPRFGVNASGAAFFVCHCCNDKHRWADFRKLIDTLAPRPPELPRAGRATDNSWPVPLSLEAELPPVAALDDRLLPEVFRPLCVDVADRMCVFSPNRSRISSEADHDSLVVDQ